MNTSERIGWGEPVSLELAADEADAVRNMLEGGYSANFRSEGGRRVLLSAFIPPVEACKPTRDKIEKASAWIGGIDNPPDESDPSYSAFERSANNAIRGAVLAFKARPEGCEMEMSGDQDAFDCRRCHFERTTDPWV